MHPAATELALEGLSPGESFVFKWQYDWLGPHAAAFVKAFCLADNENQARYARGFPVEAEALRSYFTVEDWWPNVQAKARAMGYLKPEQE